MCVYGVLTVVGGGDGRHGAGQRRLVGLQTLLQDVVGQARVGLGRRQRRQQRVAVAEGAVVVVARVVAVVQRRERVRLAQRVRTRALLQRPRPVV